MSLFLSFILGMFVAWFFIPAPSFAVTFRDWLISKVPFLRDYVRKE